MADKVLNTCPMTDSQSGVIIDHMSGHSMLAAHQQIGNDAETNRKFELDKLKEKVDKVTPEGAQKKTVDQIVNHWNYLRQEAKKYNVNKVVFRKLTGNPVEKTFLRDEKHERVLSVVGTSHNNGLNLTTELGLPKVRVIQVPSATVKALMASSSKKPPTLNSVMKQLQKENVIRLTTCPTDSSLQKSPQVYLAGSNSNIVRQPLSSYETNNSSNNTRNSPATYLLSAKKSAAPSISQSITPGSSKLKSCQSVSLHGTVQNSDVYKPQTKCTSSSTQTAEVSISKDKRLTMIHHASTISASSSNVHSTGCAGVNSSSSIKKSTAMVSVLKSKNHILNHPSTVSASPSSQAASSASKLAIINHSSSVQSTQCSDTIKNAYSRNTVADIGFPLTHEQHDSLSSISNKSKQVMKKRQRTPAKNKTQIMLDGNLSFSFGAAGTNSIAKSMGYSQYGNLWNCRNRRSSVLAAAVQKSTTSMEEMQAQLKIANDLKREELEIKKQYYQAKIDKLNREK